MAGGSVEKGAEMNGNRTKRLHDGRNKTENNETAKPLVVALLQLARDRFARVAAFKR